jgi:hypothetical protein
MARQGHAFATSDEARVVYQPPSEGPVDYNAPLVDVPRDGKTLGEIVVRGNVVMKEVRNMILSAFTICSSIYVVFQRSRGNKESFQRSTFWIW